jgi:hypothetical protein
VPLAPSLQGSQCDRCKEEKPQYFLFGPLYYMALGLRGSLMPTAIEKLGMRRTCLDCTKDTMRRWSFRAWLEAYRSLRSPNRFDLFWPVRRMLLAGELSHTPPYAFFCQFADWPVCCRTCCEFVGYPDRPESLREIVWSSRYWERGRRETSSVGAINDTEEYSTDINLFRCGRCGAKYYTHQFT